MEEWLIVIFIALLITVKRETDNQRRLKQIFKDITDDVSKTYDQELEELTLELHDATSSLQVSQDSLQQQDGRIKSLTDDIESKKDIIEQVNERISKLKLEILKFQNTIKDEQQKFTSTKFSSESIEAQVNKFLRDKNQLLSQIRELELSITEKAANNKKLRTKYDETIFRILETKAKRVSILEKLKLNENENDTLNKYIKETLFQLKQITANFKQLEELEAIFKNHWNPLLSTLKIEASALEKSITDDLSMYENIKKDHLHPDKIKTILDKFTTYEIKALEEIELRKDSYSYILNDINKSYDILIQNLYFIVDRWLNGSSSRGTTTSGGADSANVSPAQYSHFSGDVSDIIRNYNVDTTGTTDSNELTRILKTNLFSDLNIRHLGSIVNDSSFIPTSSSGNDSRNSNSQGSYGNVQNDSSVHTDNTSYSPGSLSLLSINEGGPANTLEINDNIGDGYFGVESISPMQELSLRGTTSNNTTFDNSFQTSNQNQLGFELPLQNITSQYYYPQQQQQEHEFNFHSQGVQLSKYGQQINSHHNINSNIPQRPSLTEEDDSDFEEVVSHEGIFDHDNNFGTHPHESMHRSNSLSETRHVSYAMGTRHSSASVSYWPYNQNTEAESANLQNVSGQPYFFNNTSMPRNKRNSAII